MMKFELPNLLNVKEAAAFLNVSKMTIKRWTDAGIMPWYRLGKKRERRFRPQGLHEFLTGGKDASTPGNVPLRFRGLRMLDGSHLTRLHRDQKEALDMHFYFVRQGIESKEGSRKA
ncbi:helix-turn-helix domain-containing protein [Desulfosoma sp.]|uniref:helix-turn-helix domain-containing protein n=2 Tax=Desulfosoma sp. TaxID=2603217 RepID=UPI00404A6F48